MAKKLRVNAALLDYTTHRVRLRRKGRRVSVELHPLNTPPSAKPSDFCVSTSKGTSPLTVMAFVRSKRLILPNGNGLKPAPKNSSKF